MTKPTPQVLIAGAGPTGLAMAIEMARFGIPFRLIDKSEQPARYSQALVVQARTLEQFERYGIANTAVAQGRKLLKGSLISDRQIRATFSFDSIPGNYPFLLFLPQNDTERILSQRLAELGGAIERGVQLMDLENGPDGVKAQLRGPDGAMENASARWLIGCDGAHSTVREKLGIPFEGDTVGLSFFLGDLELRGPNVPGDELRVYLAHGDVVFIGRLKENLYRVIVAFHSEQSSAGAPREPELADFQSGIDRNAGDGITVVSSVWKTPFRINQRKARHYRAQSAFLAGDACHIHSPVAGQGMNTGIQDAANLAWKIAAVAHGADPALVDSYDEERGAVGEALLRSTSRGLAAATLSNPLATAIRDRIAHLASSFAFAQHALAGFISETAIGYRKSSIVEDCGGGGELRAGDRMPNPDIAQPGGGPARLLDPLQDGRALVLSTDHEILERLPWANGMDVPPDLETLLGSGPRVIVIRPDGYIGFRGAPRDAARLEEYARLTGLSGELGSLRQNAGN